ncbi:hypothetical protein ACI2KR_08560 [Pseudomonas luteola]
MNRLFIDADTERELSIIEREALDAEGNLKVLPSEFYRRFNQTSLSFFCLKHGLYGLPTFELLDVINAKIMEASPSRNAIEIGSGNGALGKGLGITCTDSFLHDSPEIRSHYRRIGQPVTKYGTHLVHMDALTAVKHYRPDVVVASWVTHLSIDNDNPTEGSPYGVDEEEMLGLVSRYILVGNLKPHGKKPLLKFPHETIRGDFLFSRSMSSDQCVLLIWDR